MPVDQPIPSQAPERFAHRLWRCLGRPLFIILVFTWFIRGTLADWRDVPSESMEPTIQPGDRILVNMMAYGYHLPLLDAPVKHNRMPEVGDVIVFRLPGTRHTMVKRVIGLPGDSIEIIDRVLYRNGEAATYKSGITGPDGLRWTMERFGDCRHPVLFDDERPRDVNYPRTVVPADHVFVLGDNRDHSSDGRVFGFIHRDHVLGKVYSVAFSIDTQDGIRCRGDRWFKPVR